MPTSRWALGMVPTCGDRKGGGNGLPNKGEGKANRGMGNQEVEGSAPEKALPVGSHYKWFIHKEGGVSTKPGQSIPHLG